MLVVDSFVSFNRKAAIYFIGVHVEICSRPHCGGEAGIEIRVTDGIGVLSYTGYVTDYTNPTLVLKYHFTRSMVMPFVTVCGVGGRTLSIRFHPFRFG